MELYHRNKSRWMSTYASQRYCTERKKNFKMWFTLNCCKVKMKIPNSKQKKQFKKLCIFMSIFSIHHDSDSAWSYVKNVCILNCTIIIYNGSGGLVLHSYYTGFVSFTVWINYLLSEWWPVETNCSCVWLFWHTVFHSTYQRGMIGTGWVQGGGLQ